MAARSRQDSGLIAPDELERLLEVEHRLERELADVRAEAGRRVDAAAAFAAEERRRQEADCELAGIAQGELLARRIDERRDLERWRSAERLERLAAFERDTRERLVELVLRRIEGRDG